MRRDAWYPGLVSVARAVLCWCSAFWLFNLTERGEPRGVDVIPYLLFGLLCFLFFAWFLRKPKTIPVLVAAGAVLWVAGSVVLLWKFSDLTGFASNFFGVASVFTVVLVSVRACLEPPAAAKSISALEVTTLFFVFFLWVQIMYKLSMAYSLPLLTAALLSMSVVVYQRLSTVGGAANHGRLRGVAVVAAMLVVIVAVLVLFMAFGAAPLGQGALMLYYGVCYCLKLAWRIVEMILYWLVSLFPDAEGEIAAEAPIEVIAMEEVPEEMQLPPWMLALLGMIGLCVVAAVVVYILFQMRKIRIGGRQVIRTGPAVQRKKLPLGRWLRRLLEALRSRAQLLVATLTMRGSPQELYLYLRRAGRRLDCRQLSGETPCAFVRRAARVTADSTEPELPRALEKLAQALGACLYAPTAPEPLPKETVQCIRRSFRRALRKARREQLRRWFAAKLSGKKNETAGNTPS